jgi:hypothetical protein
MPKRAGRFRLLARGRTGQRGQMNKTETEYSKLLDDDPGVIKWWFEAASWRLSNPPEGQPARYTPDFMVLRSDGSLDMVEVKGTGPDDAASIVRLKCAAEQYSAFAWILAKKKKQKDGGGWRHREV